MEEQNKPKLPKTNQGTKEENVSVEDPSFDRNADVETASSHPDEPNTNVDMAKGAPGRTFETDSRP